MKKIIIATANAGKIKEFKEIFSDYEISSLLDIDYLDEIEETGETFEENSLLKAATIMDYLKEKNITADVIADDSGLCVNALGGAPGVYSARYAGDHDTEANIKKLIENLENEADRSAYFKCVLTMLHPDNTHEFYVGESHGEILTEKVGDGGFGYDPIFFSDDLKKSFGVATAEEKNSVSHRGRAVSKLKEVYFK